MTDLSFPLRSTFLALPLEGKPKWLFQALQEELRPFDDILSLQNPQTSHLTLQFWKEVMEIEYGQISGQAQKIAAASSPFSLRVTGVDMFGSHGEDRVIFLSVAFSDELARLKKSCPWPSDGKFSPHITLARIRHPQKFAVQKKKILKALGEVDFEIPVELLRLYAEVDGRKQTPLEDFSLAS